MELHPESEIGKDGRQFERNPSPQQASLGNNTKRGKKKKKLCFRIKNINYSQSVKLMFSASNVFRFFYFFFFTVHFPIRFSKTAAKSFKWFSC